MSVGSIGESRHAQTHRSFEEVEIDDGSSLVSSLLVEGDIGAQVAALVIRNAQSQRETSGRVQLAEEAALEREEAAQIAELHDKADHVRWSGIVDGGFTVLSGGCTFAGSSAIAGSASRESWRGAATGAEGAGKILGGLPKAAQADDEAAATQHEHAAGHHRRAIDAARDAARDGEDLLEHALDFYKQNQQGEAEATRAGIGRR